MSNLTDTNLLDKLFIKRFCLPFDTNIENYEKGFMNVNSCLCGHYNHACYVLQGKWDYEKG